MHSVEFRLFALIRKDLSAQTGFAFRIYAATEIENQHTISTYYFDVLTKTLVSYNLACIKYNYLILP